MNEKKDFYIGWQDKMPQNNRKFLKKILILLFIGIPLLVLMVVIFQKPFNSHQFELGTIKEFTGIYYEKPVPVLEVSQKSIPEGFSNYILLVGYGKFGVEGILNAIKKERSSINGKKVTIRGTLIYGDGKTVMELTEKEKSLVKVHGYSGISEQKEKPEKEVQLTGEILDPKCYFGVMKPGEGKIHKSCAIRCISGGIPPVFRTASGTDDNAYNYYIILGTNGEKINEEVLPFVAENISISGKLSRQNGWDVIYISPQEISTMN